MKDSTPRQSAPWGLIAATLALLLSGWACSLISPTPVAASRTATPTDLPQASPTVARPHPNTPEPATPIEEITRPPIITLLTPSAPNTPGAPATPVPAGPWLVYTRDEGKTLVALPANVPASSVQGGAAPIAISLPSGVLWPSDLSAGAFPAGGWLAVRVGQAKTADISLALIHLPDGAIHNLIPLVSSDLQKDAQAVPGARPAEPIQAVSQPEALSWSPDGNTLAFVSAQDAQFPNESSDLYLFDARTEKIRRFTTGMNQVATPAWSPDGLWVVFQEVVSYGTGSAWKLSAVWAGAADHNEFRKLYVPPSNSIREEFPAWSAADTLLADTRAPDSARDLRSVPLSGRAISPLYAGPMDLIAVDPASQTLAITESDTTGGQLGLAPGVYRLPGFQGTPENVQAGAWKRLSWSPGIKRFLAGGIQGLLLFTPGGDATLLKDETWGSSSPDGQWLVCFNAGSDEPGSSRLPGLRLYQPGGVKLQDITSDPVQDVSWQPDSKGFYYLAGDKLYQFKFPEATPVLIDQGVQAGGLGWVVSP